MHIWAKNATIKKKAIANMRQPLFYSNLTISFFSLFIIFFSSLEI